MFSWLWENLLSMGLTLIMLMSEVSLRKMKLTSKVREGWSWWKQIATLKFEFLVVSIHFLYFYRTQIYLGSDLCVRVSLSETPCWDLTDVTLADEDTYSILTNSANRAIQGNVTRQLMQPGGQLWNQCMWRHPMHYVSGHWIKELKIFEK